MNARAPQRVTPIQPQPVRPAGWSTPTILRVCLVLLWLADAIFLSAVITGARTHRNSMKTVGRDTAPSIIAAQHIKAAMAGMDVSTTSELLMKPGQTQKALAAYKSRRLEAGKALISAAENITFGDKERGPLQTLESGLGNYAEFAQRARDLHEKGDPQFLASYRQAADVLDSQVYPAADELDGTNGKTLNSIYDSQVWKSLATRSSVVMAGLLLLFVLLSVQSFLTRRMRRIFNMPLVFATLVALWLLGYTITEFQMEMVHLKVAKQDAFDSIHALWRARAVAYAANADESRYLLDDANSAVHDQAFLARSKDVTLKYLGAEQSNITFPGERDAANETVHFFDDYLRIDQEVRRLKQAGKRDAAVALCLGTGEEQAKGAFQRFDEALGRTLDINQKAFDAAVLHGEQTLENFQVKAVLACLAIGILSLVGLLRRIQEYR